MSTFIRLTDYKSSDEKEKGFFEPKNRYEAKQEDFDKIPGSPIAYWVSDKIISSFKHGSRIEDLAPVRQGFQTGDNDRFLRYWYEVSIDDCGFSFTSTAGFHSSLKGYAPYNKGGEFKKWYGNNDYLVKFDSKNYKTLSKMGNNLPSKHLYFKNSLTWSALSSGSFGARFNGNGFTFSAKGACAFPSTYEATIFIISLLNSKVSSKILEFFSPTLDFNVGDIRNIPLISNWNEYSNITNSLTQQNIDISKEEWDSRETSWDFTKNELLKHKQDGQLENALNAYSSYWTNKFNTLHSNEEELNRLFIDIYGLQDELTPDVALEDITILKSEAKITDGKLVFGNKEIIKQFISYAVGCMFGRYSLDIDGLVVANMNQSIPTDTTYEIDDDNIIPIVDESDYFSDDMTDRFTEFVKMTFGSEKLQQNIAFIEASLGKKIRAYFMKDFYTDHTKRYKKRPIYWLFSSPKATFQVLIYMHRYTPDTLNNILNDYLRPFRIRLDTMRNEALRVTESEDVSARDKTEADKKIDKIDQTLTDINEYEKTLAHYAAQRIEINLDDGAKVNYCKFQDLLFKFDVKLCK